MKKIKILWSNRLFHNYILFLVCFLLLEILFHLIDHIPILGVASIRIFLGLNILALFLAYISSFLPKMVGRIWNCLWVLVATIYGMAELGFHNFLGVYASIGTSTQLGAVSSYIKDFLGSFKFSFYTLFIPFILLFLYYLFLEKRVCIDMPKKRLTNKVILFKMIPIFIIIVLSLGYCFTLKVSFLQDKYQSLSAYQLFKKPTNASLVIRNFGYIGYGLLDIKEYFLPGASLSSISIDPNELLESDNKEEETDSEAIKHTLIKNKDWLSIIEDESDSELNTLNKYFIRQDVDVENQYTGMFKNKNVIMIMVESGSNIMLDEKYYPNIYELLEHSISFTNHYSPRNICSTGNNEMGAMISLYSINNNCTANVYKNNTYFESIFNLFNNKGYQTSSFHDYYDWYYDRTTIHKNMGSSHFYNAVDLGLDFSYNYPAYDTWASDVDLMKKYLEILDNRDSTKPFMSFITTVSSHMPYNMSSEYGDMYMDLFPASYSTELKRYMSKLKVVDEAIGVLLDGLEDREILRDTVIVLFADHYPYSISTDKLNVYFDDDISVDNNADKTPLLIYQSSLEKKEIDTYTSQVDILPTIANLFSLDYDSRLYMGSDALSKNHESLVIFVDGSWKNELAFYNASTNKIKYYTQKNYSREEILAFNTKVRLKLEMSGLAIEKNYFHYLEESLNNLTTSK